MSDQLLTALIISGVALLCMLLWGFSIAFVFWDVNRRQLPGREQIAWLALSAVIPIIGFSAYLFARVLNVFFSPRPQAIASPTQRHTDLKRPEGVEERLPTFAAAELNRETRLDLNPEEEKSQPVSASLYSLIVVEGPDSGSEYFIEHLPVHIGRGPQADVAVNNDLGVSRKHAEIYVRGGILRIRDLKSTHGTLVNGYSIDDKSLDPGDHIQVGQTTLLFNVEEK